METGRSFLIKCLCSGYEGKLVSERILNRVSDLLFVRKRRINIFHILSILTVTFKTNYYILKRCSFVSFYSYKIKSQQQYSGIKLPFLYDLLKPMNLDYDALSLITFSFLIFFLFNLSCISSNDSNPAIRSPHLLLGQLQGTYIPFIQTKRFLRATFFNLSIISKIIGTNTTEHLKIILFVVHTQNH